MAYRFDAILSSTISLNPISHNCAHNFVRGIMYSGHYIRIYFGVCEPSSQLHRSISATLILNKKCLSPTIIAHICIKISHCVFDNSSHTRNVFMFSACTTRFVGAEDFAFSHCSSHRTLVCWRSALLAAAARRIIGLRGRPKAHQHFRKL